MERDRGEGEGGTEERGATAAGAAHGVTRSQNMLYVLPHDPAAIRQWIAPALERVDRAAGEVQVLVITADEESAVSIARVAGETAHDVRALPVTSARRGARLIQALSPHLVAAAAGDLVELVRGAQIKLGGVRTAIIAWADDLLDAGASESLEVLLSELPKDGARVLVTSRLTADVEQLVERYARRAGRVGAAGAPSVAADEPAAGARGPEIRYVAVSSSSRATALRRVLDELDPPSAAVYARSELGLAEAEGMLRALGFRLADGAVRITRGEPVPTAAAIVMYELPATAAELQRLREGGSAQLVALVQPRQLGALRSLAPGGRVQPMTLGGPAGRARSREEAAREELRAVLREGTPSREILALEPLLEEYDGVELAAAAMRLLDRARERGGKAAVRESASEGGGRSSGSPWTKLFMTVGERDGATARDIVGAVTGEIGVSRDKVGKVEMRESHTVVEIANDVAEQVVKGMTGVTIRGRRVVARVDAGREGGARDRPRGGPREGREGRGPRDARGPRDPRESRGPRGPKGPRGPGARPARPARPDRPERRPLGPDDLEQPQ